MSAAGGAGQARESARELAQGPGGGPANWRRVEKEDVRAGEEWVDTAALVAAIAKEKAMPADRRKEPCKVYEGLERRKAG